MSVNNLIRPTKSSKVHYSEYIRTENKPDEGQTKAPEPSDDSKSDS